MKRERIFTQAEKDAAVRLKKIWYSKKKELNLTQEKVAQMCGWGNQSAFGAYLHARVQLNVEAVLKLAKVLKVHPAEIMPEIEALLPDSINTNNESRSNLSYGLTDGAYKKIRHSIARKIKFMRENAGLNQRELASKAGVSQKTVSNLEDPDSHSCQLDKLQCIAVTLGVEVWELIKPDEVKVLESKESGAALNDGLTDDAMEFARAFQALPPEQRAVLEQTAKAFISTAKKQNGKVG